MEPHQCGGGMTLAEPVIDYVKPMGVVRRGAWFGAETGELLSF